MKVKILASLAIIFITTFYAFYTDHRWEDWYITFKASKNLALGNGLVYHVGEQVMTYTSPLGVLLPAFIKWFFLSEPDDYVIWIFRLINVLILASIPFFLIDIFKKFNVQKRLIYLGLLLFTFNILIVDNTINGMESAMMLFFISYLLWTLFVLPRKWIWHLAICSAGLMYTRPDGFIYGGAIILCYIFFNKLYNQKSEARTKAILIAILIAILLYLPWLTWSWWYYGSPIPHTIVAKSVSQPYGFFTLIKGFVGYNLRLVSLESSVTGSLFMPACSWQFGSWDYFVGLNKVSAFFGLIVSLYWLNPKASNEIRLISLAVYIVNFYLARISGQGPMSWYMPSVILPSIIVFILIINELYSKIHFNKVYKTALITTAFILLVFSITMFYFGSIQMKAHQEIVELNNRTKIGLYVKENARYGDRIYMECLGYIGFYSELKTLDFPGMSSPEVVAARKNFTKNDNHDMYKLAYILKPEWLILRHWEYYNTKLQNEKLFDNMYTLKRKFDVSHEVTNRNLKFGSAYLYHDAVFYVFELNERYRGDYNNFTENN